MIQREISEHLIRLLSKFPAVTLTGPRQSGKTTLIKATFPDLPYLSLENPDDRQFALEDPRGFLDQFKVGAILDEVQRTPELFSYLQGVIDDSRSKKFVLSGSQNFLLIDAITQSLAGRVGILKLLPFSLAELSNSEVEKPSLHEQLFTGFYPTIYDRDVSPQDFYPSYIQTYVERDVRQLTQVRNLGVFTNFLKLCAGRVGQLLNMSEISVSLGISVNTIKAWIGILEASFIVFKLQPHHRNYNKRMVKMPKLYFYDTGLLCYLLGIRKSEEVISHFAAGSIFENFVIAEIIKQFYNASQLPNIYFWRDHKGMEVDLIIENGQQLIPIEIKSAQTKSTNQFKGLVYWNELTGNSPENSFVVYGGNEGLETKNGQLLSWRSLSKQKWFQ